MDNKITKRRLADFLSYEWGLVVIFLVVAILLWEMLFGFASVPVTTAQEFGIFIDKNVRIGNGDLGVFVSNSLSYEIMGVKVDSENEEEQFLRIKSDVHDIDIIFSDTVKAKTDNSVRLHTVIDGFPVYDFNSLLRDACDYLGKNILKQGVEYPYIEKVTNIEDAYKNKQDISMPSLKAKVDILTAHTIENDKIVYTNIDDTKIENFFLERAKNDNRFRSEEEKKKGLSLEKERLNMLIEAVGQFYTILEKGKDIDGFFCVYTKYKQLNELAGVVLDEVDLNNPGDYLYTALYAQEVNFGRENAIYGINLDKLAGKNNINDYLQLTGTAKADGVALSVFNFTEYQPHTQFETISVVNNIVKKFSNVLD